MLRVDEAVTVAVDKAGSPIGFSWRNENFLVSAPPVRWFARREWWNEAARVQRGIGAGVLEVEMWRLLACANAKNKSQFELVHNAGDGSWRLVRIFE
jgi:hypothetical protein